MSKEERLLRLRNHLEFIRTSKVPTTEKMQKPHKLIVTEALNYLYELDDVEILLDSMYVDNFIITTHHQFDALISKHPHQFFHCGNYIKVAELTVVKKHHFIVAITPVSEL